MDTNVPASSGNFSNSQNQKPPVKPKTGCLGTTMIIVVVVALLIILGIPGCISYNRLVSREVELKAKWSNVETLLQKRAALYNNIADIVEASAKLENKTLVEVTEARSKATSITINKDSINSETLSKAKEKLSGMESSFSRLLAVREAYPDLKFPDQYTSLKSDIKEIEKSVADAKIEFNNSVASYNELRRSFPTNIAGWMFGFEKSYLNFETKGVEFENKYSPEKDAAENKKLIKKD